MKQQTIRKNNISGNWEHKLQNQTDKWGIGIIENDNVLLTNDSNNVPIYKDNKLIIYEGLNYYKQEINTTQLVREDFYSVINSTNININEITEPIDDTVVSSVTEDELDLTYDG